MFGKCFGKDTFRRDINRVLGGIDKNENMK